MAQVGYNVVASSGNGGQNQQMMLMGENTICLPVENRTYAQNTLFQRLGPISYEITSERAITVTDLIHDVYPRSQYYDGDWQNKYFEIFEVGYLDLYNSGWTGNISLIPDNYYWDFFTEKSYSQGNTFQSIYPGYAAPVNTLASGLNWTASSTLFVQHKYADRHLYGWYFKYQILDYPGQQSYEYYVVRVYSMGSFKKNWVGYMKGEFGISYLPSFSSLKYDNFLENSAYWLDSPGLSTPFDPVYATMIFPQIAIPRSFYNNEINTYGGNMFSRIYFLGANHADGNPPDQDMSALPGLQYLMNPIETNSSVRVDQLQSGAITFNQNIGGLSETDLDKVLFKCGIEDPWTGNIWTHGL